MVLGGIAYDSSTKGKCADTKMSETTENCEAGNGVVQMYVLQQ